MRSPSVHTRHESVTSVRRISSRLNTHAQRSERAPGKGPLVESTRRAAEIAVAVHEERHRLARELHDSVAQTLYGITLSASRVLMLLEASGGCQVRLSLADEPDIAPSTKATLARIAREALHNIAKHAQATYVDLVLEAGPSDVTLLVADDGRGFDPQASHPGHFGLQLMCEQAMAVGAALELVSAPGRGTQVRVRVGRRRR
jgi:signal transduction histidine kinase